MSADRLPVHVSVLPAETLALLDPRPDETWVDCTTGGAGHTRLIAERVGPAGRVLALDQDPTMLALARPLVAGLPVELVHANFDQLAEVLAARGIAAVDGVLADLGFSSDQLAERARGLSFRDDGPLDMRLDPTSGSTAADMVNSLSEGALADVFWEYGEERHSRRVAKKIVARRAERPFATTADLASVVRSCVPRSGSIDPATRVFQALRIAVNDELGSLDRLLAVLPTVVKSGGRVGIISFHSLEDRRVKHVLRTEGVWRPLTKKPVEAGDEEVARNPRARSAKLRAATRIG
ncbi:Ribosomal RNA small subunit methyltransferase H [Gemmata obscuriglobus]|uniref:Ribosomal RNA small subunit methyltransferase H n=1 Tax=Gemmata obscuriglobus TaxID=114 RepID=A0A2Z3H6H1_9BACT|nr:16S rRNA (cytosine(1402)-N(4))-methyltransferase RsmH [Gemmata obscuriglobus]AWM41358.1 16S rRNA (cytosine(1402)-N(4))-methyltransferase RsmH [Gemmata obscuriglobus]QEG25288.1 Ribosomal RNA small subunit methyltransferase H [Gemmata obscuriglobus]VTR98126.1 16s rrna methyltransferase : Ribosomal RNA small subunit methyltransferase H OS=Singulisphaera acidiphila (strain ATCC BAA-1392 / DSM 18658 / VKM B-2454 / MOB10) GN=rsmH PE=3 SV=1: Methyltransf_5 [Gemmata obscuriglobus UQM 2246]